MQPPMERSVSLASCSRSCTGPWHSSQVLPFARCARWLKSTHDGIAYTRAHGTALPSLSYSARRLILGLSALIAEWHCMQVAAGTMVIVSPGSGLGWHILHASFMVPACILWLKGRGWGGGSAAYNDTAHTSAAATVHSLICCECASARRNTPRRASPEPEWSWWGSAN